MFKACITATMAITLLSGVALAETSTMSTTSTEYHSSPAADVDVSKTTHSTVDRDGMTVDKEKTVRKDVTPDRGMGVGGDHVTIEKEKRVTHDPD